MTPSYGGALPASDLMLFSRLMRAWRPLMALGMLRGRQGYEILWAVVQAVPVDVMNSLIGLQRDTIGVFPHRTVFRNVSFRVGAEPVRQIQECIAPANNTTAFPSWGLLTSLTLPLMSMKVSGAVSSLVAWFTARVTGRNNIATPAGANGSIGQAARRSIGSDGHIQPPYNRLKPVYQKVEV